MSKISLVSAAENGQAGVPLQPASYDVWDKKYRLKTKDEKPVDANILGTYERVSAALAGVETSEKKQKFWQEEFLWALLNGAIPAGRILSNAGAQAHKPATSTINCTVSGSVDDSMSGILEKLQEAGMTLKAGCGIGYEFSTLRPKGAYVAGAGAKTSGPLSFMDIYDKMCFTVSSAGGRRGAQMATFDIAHPDILDFIRVKKEDGRLRQFNLSCLISDEFMLAVENDDVWPLSFEGKVLDTVKARRLWDSIMSATYDYAEPGFILIDRVNEMNNNWFCENIRATNPCGEQPLPPYGACLLGSINLTHFVQDAFTDKVVFDWEKYKKVVSVFTRMLDNVVEINGLPLEQQRQELYRKRRHGMGFLGLGSCLAMMKIAYGSEASLEFTEEVSRVMAVAGWEAGLELADEKGPAPIMDEEFEVTEEMLTKRPEMMVDGICVGDRLPGKMLIAKYSRYMQQFDQSLTDRIAEKGCRFTHHTSIAPTGTISLSLANNVSNGIEPSFSHHYSRNIIQEGRKTKEKVDVFSFELLAYRHMINADAHPTEKEGSNQLPEYFVSADEITPLQHVDVQAAAQKWIDSSISKTANVPTDYDFEKFKDIYQYAYKKGLKGCTTFRFNPEVFQGVLVKEEDLAATTYRFTLADGTHIEAKGGDIIEYEDEKHTAANLFDALKEGYYGKL